MSEAKIDFTERICTANKLNVARKQELTQRRTEVIRLKQRIKDLESDQAIWESEFRGLEKRLDLTKKANRKLTDMVNGCTQRIKEFESAQWRSVKDDPPIEYTDKFVLIHNGYSYGILFGSQVLTSQYWQPLPSPPEPKPDKRCGTCGHWNHDEPGVIKTCNWVLENVSKDHDPGMEAEEGCDCKRWEMV